MLITLTSDMGLKDYYVAAIKGSIYNQLPEAKVVDISHDIPPFDIAEFTPGIPLWPIPAVIGAPLRLELELSYS